MKSQSNQPMSKIKIESGSHSTDGAFKIVVTEKGPYIVYGQPPLVQQFIMANDRGESWFFQEGSAFLSKAEPMHLCRCGASKNKPFCDGSHGTAQWSAELTAPMDGLLDQAEVIQGETLALTDNEKYCVFARFCYPEGNVWQLTEESSHPKARQLVIREASLCPGGRLMAWDKKTKKPYEFRFEPSLGLIEDPEMRNSGGLWVRGGIPIQREDGATYEIRNRVVLCRCGQSSNKPYCDGTHAVIKWKDGLDEHLPKGETTPIKVH